MSKAAQKPVENVVKAPEADKARDKAREVATRAINEARARQLKAGGSTKKEIAAIKDRDVLINQYMPYAASIANRVCQSLSSAVDYEDVLCNARLGLLEAAKRYDESQAVDFKTFAYYRIKGAIYDGLRRSGWLPRTLYAKMKFEEAANEYLQNKSLHNAGSVHMGATLFEDDSAIAETVNSLASIYIISLDASEDIDVEDQNAIGIEQRTEFMQIRRYMRDAITALPEQEKQLVMMYYFQNRTLGEIGVKMGLSKSWTSRLHARALTLLFKRIRAKSSELDENLVPEQGEGEFNEGDGE